MKRLILTMLLLSPVSILAQENRLLPPPDSLAASSSAVGDSGASQPTAPPLRQPEPRTRRRPSMVGYVDDAIVGSRVRIRFDAGLHDHVPDRAEFFYGKCGCFRDLTPTLPVFDPDASGPGPGVTTDVNFQQLYFEAEYAPTRRFSVFGSLPVRWLQPQVFVPDIEGRFGTFGDHAGLSDVRGGVKAGLAVGDDRAVTAQLQVYAPTGESREGLGTNHWSVEPSLLYYQRLADRVNLESEFGAWLPTGGSPGVPTAGSEKFSGKVIYYGIGPSVTLYDGRQFQFTPVVELVGWHVVDGFQTAADLDAGGTDIVNIKVGARFGFGDRSSIYFGYGHALTDAHWYDDIVRTEYRFSF
jgi:hypothetical protein